MGTAFTSLGTILQVTISSVLTALAGVRDVEFEAPELELYDRDDLVDDYVQRDASGRTSGGSVKGSMLWDPASATNTKLIALFNSPTVTSGVYVPEVWAIVWSSSPAATQGFSGYLTKQTRKAERGAPLMNDFEIQTARKPTLV